MARHLALLVLMCVGSGGVASADLLVNGDFESPGGGPLTTDVLPGWTLIEPSVDVNGDPLQSATFWQNGAANHTPGGARGLWLQPFHGMTFAPVDAILLQDVAAHAGVHYSLSAWFKFETHYTTQATFLAIDFLDGDLNVLSSVVSDINGLNPRDGVWREFAVDGIAGAGTEFLRARVEMVGGMNPMMNPQSALVDDLVLVPGVGVGVWFGVGGVWCGRRRRRG
ncbi:MAG: hypothetical protein ACTS3F_12255 [Phycisphaerales bacterium]